MREASGPGAITQQARSRDATSPLILIVEDYDDSRQMYVQYLTFAGFRVAEAVNGREAIDQATRSLPDLIVMDLSLPEVDGWEATRRLKADQRTKRVPVIALTGHALVGHSKTAKEAGCDHYITKPCLPEDLVAEIRRVLGGRQKLRKGV
jgi:two-component system, cell cycle response regulator DivK